MQPEMLGSPGVFTTGGSCRALAVFTIPDPTATGDPVAIATRDPVVPAPRTRNPGSISGTGQTGQVRLDAVPATVRCAAMPRRVPPHTAGPGPAAHRS